MAYAARSTLVTVERVVDDNLLASEMSAAGPSLRSMSRPSPSRRAAPRPTAYGASTRPTSPNCAVMRPPPGPAMGSALHGQPAQGSCMTAAVHPREILITTIARLLDGVRHVAVGASSPIPAAGAMLRRALQETRGGAPVRLSILGSVEHNFFTNGSAELFDCAGQGRIDAFFLAAARSTARATSISSARETIRVRRRGGRDLSARPISISSSRGSSSSGRNTRRASSCRRWTSSARRASAVPGSIAPVGRRRCSPQGSVRFRQGETWLRAGKRPSRRNPRQHQGRDGLRFCPWFSAAPHSRSRCRRPGPAARQGPGRTVRDLSGFRPPDAP